MADGRVMLLLYLGGQIIEGASGSQYSRSPKYVLKIDPSATWTQFIHRLYRKTGIDSSQFKLRISCRYPLNASGPHVTYTNIPVVDEDILHDVLCIPKYFPTLSSVELYIEQEPIGNSSGFGETQSFVPETNIGSFTQFMNAASAGGVVGNDWMHYGAFIANDAMMPPPHNTQLRHRYPEEGCSSHGWDHHLSAAAEGPSSNEQWREWDQAVLASNVPDSGGAWEAEQNSHLAGNTDPMEAQFFADIHEGAGGEDSDDEGADDFPDELERQDEGADIPFFSDIGGPGDNAVDTFTDYDRPVWVDDRSSELEIGMVFKSKESVQHATKCWSVRQHRYFVVQESTPDSWFVLRGSRERWTDEEPESVVHVESMGILIIVVPIWSRLIRGLDRTRSR